MALQEIISAKHSYNTIHTNQSCDVSSSLSQAFLKLFICTWTKTCDLDIEKSHLSILQDCGSMGDNCAKFHKISLK